MIPAVLKTRLLSSARWGPQRALVERITRLMNNVLVLPICNSCEIVVGVIDLFC